MSGLMRNVIDQVLRGMGEDERARAVEYVTDQMVEKMDNAERASLLLAIVDRVLGNLTAEERRSFTTRLATQLASPPVDPGETAPVITTAHEPNRGSAPLLDTRA